jgi:hypothetical protein
LQAKSLYVCEDTNEAALISAGSCLQVGKIWQTWAVFTLL